MNYMVFESRETDLEVNQSTCDYQDKTFLMEIVTLKPEYYASIRLNLGD